MCTYAQSCKDPDATDDPLEDATPILQLELEGFVPTSQSRFLLLLTDTVSEANFIELSFGGPSPDVLNIAKWKETGVLIDTFYSRQGATSFNRKMPEGTYALQVFTPDGNKAFRHSIAFKKGERHIDVLRPRALGHIKMSVYQSSIGIGIDSNIVSLYDSTRAVGRLLDSVYFTDLELQPLHSTRTGTLKNVDLHWETGIAYFFNLPVRSYWGVAFNQIFSTRGEKNSTLTTVEVVQNRTNFYRMAFL